MEKQEIIFRLGILEQQLQQFQQQMQAVERGINELESLNLGLDEIQDSMGKEIFARIGKGIYMKAKIISDKLTVDVGGNNFVTKDVFETKKLIQEQIRKLKEAGIELEKNTELTNNEFVEIVQEYQKQEKSEE